MNNGTGKVWPRMVGLVVLLVLMIVLAAHYTGPITRLVGNSAKFGEYLESFGVWGTLVFVAIQAVQVIIAPIPGEFTQLAGGFIYGTALGTLYSCIGILIGSIVVFSLGRVLGLPILKRVIPEHAFVKFGFLLNHPRTELVILALFLIPGSPKDILTYIAGLTPVKPVRFFISAMVARFPGILLSAYIGAHVEAKEYGDVIVASIIALGLFVAGVLMQDRIVGRLKRRSRLNNIG